MKDKIYNPEIHHRHSIRLQGYDYSQTGAYFVTICTHGRKCLFGDVADGKMVLNEFGRIAKQYWEEIPERFNNIELDEYIIMPNHIHGIIIVGATLAVAQNNPVAQCRGNPRGYPRYRAGIKPEKRAGASPAPTIGNIIGAYKSIVANKCLNIFKHNNQCMGKLWQRNYYEHIIRNEMELNKIREYIIYNPLNWETDEDYIS